MERFGYASVEFGSSRASQKRRLRMRRVLFVTAIAVAFSVPASTGFVRASSPAFAGSVLTCTKVSGRFIASLIIRRCTVPLADRRTYGSASIVVSTLSSGGTITWAKSGATTTLGPATITSPGRGRCGVFDTEHDISATVTGGTSAVTNKGDTFSADVCVYKTTPAYMNSMTKLVMGTTASI
jgi:hypothetical protein